MSPIVALPFFLLYDFVKIQPILWFHSNPEDYDINKHEYTQHEFVSRTFRLFF